MPKTKSERQKVAEELADFAMSLKCENGRRVFNGPVNGYMGTTSPKSGRGKYHSVVLMISRFLDAHFMVWGTNNIYFQGQGPIYNGSKKLKGLGEAKQFVLDELT